MIKRQRDLHGENRLTPKASSPWYLKWFFSVFGGFFNILLWVGSVLSLIAFGIDEDKDLTNVRLLRSVWGLP